jgi:hypothetical protein
MDSSRPEQEPLTVFNFKEIPFILEANLSIDVFHIKPCLRFLRLTAESPVLQFFSLLG